MPKKDLYCHIDQNENALKDMAINIWRNPESAFHEVSASAIQKRYLKEHGFKIVRIPNNETAFIAEFGQGKPVLGILGEYDALPGLSQKVSSVKEPLDDSNLGHGCGHNLLGTAGVGAVVALKNVMEKENMNGTIRYYGCPAEETLAGKVLMAKEMVFHDLSACISWHPASMNVVWGCSHLAMNSIKFRFRGIPSHAAAAPQAGRSALDAVELMNVGANYLREHVIEKARIHYVITNGGMVPNVVPDDAEVWYFVRAPKRTDVRHICERLYKIAEGAELMTETKMEKTLVAGCYDAVENAVLGDLLHKNMEEAGPPKFTPEDFDFAAELSSLSTKEEKKKVMSTYFAPDHVLDQILCDEIIKVNDRNEIMAGSVDAGDVSYITPFAQFTAATWPVGTAAHTWIATASSGSGIGLNAMIFAAKALSGAVYDLLNDNSIVDAARNEFQISMGDFKYISPYEE
ncbi:MAG TPA: amidohydrolase, partial [Syntrophomonas sp.]|nr:amidohydrolase [Syntrophomonas sp.]